jgi:hypothetical protein
VLIPPVVVNGEKTTSPTNSQKRSPGGRFPAISGTAGPGQLLLGNSQVEDAKIISEKSNREPPQLLHRGAPG